MGKRTLLTMCGAAWGALGLGGETAGSLFFPVLRSCIVLYCSAHRLETIADYDRILILDNGSVAEYDTPAALLANPQSAFARMMAESRGTGPSAPATSTA